MEGIDRALVNPANLSSLASFVVLDGPLHRGNVCFALLAELHAGEDLEVSTSEALLARVRVALRVEEVNCIFADTGESVFNWAPCDVIDRR